MSSDQGKQTEIEQQTPATKEEKIDSTELTDVNMDKVAGGTALPPEKQKSIAHDT